MALGLTTIAELLVRTGLVTAVDETPDLTVFAPSNEAFQAAAATLGKLDAAAVATVLKAHGRSAPGSLDRVNQLTVRSGSGSGRLQLRVEGR